MYAQDNILCQFGPIICHSPTYSFLHQFSTIFGGNCITTVPHSLLSKRHNILSYHRVREAIAAKILVFHRCDSFQNKSDILSKHWEFSKVFHIISYLFDFQERYHSSSKSTENKYLKKWSDMIYIKTHVLRSLRYYSPAPRNTARSDCITENITQHDIHH